MPFPHTKDIIYADFLLPPLNQKAVGIEEEDNRKNNDNRPCIDQNQVQVGVADCRVSGQSIHNIVHHYRQDCRQNIRDVGLPVILKIRQCKFAIDRTTHPSHLP